MKKLDKLTKTIYSEPYDDLSEYGKGVRDLMNYLNGSEDITQEDIIKWI